MTFQPSIYIGLTSGIAGGVTPLAGVHYARTLLQPWEISIGVETVGLGLLLDVGARAYFGEGRLSGFAAAHGAILVSALKSFPTALVLRGTAGIEWIARNGMTVSVEGGPALTAGARTGENAKGTGGELYLMIAAGLGYRF